MGEESIRISEVVAMDKKLLARLNLLFCQLTPSYKKMSGADFEEIIRAGQTYLYIARDSSDRDRVVGTLTMVTYRIPTGLNARIEDVVVDEASRGRGIGRQLMRHAIGEAAKKGIKNINLTSSPFRVAANKLYQVLGFEQRETNVYRLRIK